MKRKALISLIAAESVFRGVRYPLRDIISKRHCAIWGGISNSAAKVLPMSPHLRAGTSSQVLAMRTDTISEGHHSNEEGTAKEHYPPLNKDYHPFQNHYTHEIIILELVRGLQLQLSKVCRINLNCSYSFLSFLRNAVTDNNSRQETSRICCNDSYMI